MLAGLCAGFAIDAVGLVAAVLSGDFDVFGAALVACTALGILLMFLRSWRRFGTGLVLAQVTTYAAWVAFWALGLSHMGP